MSASEKLRAVVLEHERLIATLDASNIGPASLLRAKITDALPQIVVVVEAAETVVDDFDIVMGPIVDALAALDEALK